MITLTPPAAGPPSPCTGVCRMAADGLCLGCARSMDEISAWPTMNAQTKRAVLAALPRRRRGGARD